MATIACFAKEIPFELSVEKEAMSLGEQVALNLTFNGTQDIPALEFPATPGIRAQYIGPSTRMSVINGKVSSSISHSYALVPIKAGSFNLGPLKFDYRGDTYVSNAIKLEVLAGPVPAATGAQGPRDASVMPDLNDRVYLVFKPAKERAYVNELIPISVKLYVNKLGVRDITNPEFVHESFSKTEFEQSKPFQEMVNGVAYAVVEFSASLFGLRPGDFKVGPAAIKCNLIAQKQAARGRPSGFDDFFDQDFFGGFFDRYQLVPLSLQSSEVPITILPLPEENKPEGFSGAVGDFSLEVSATPSEVKVGDPITVKMAVQGQGNFNTVEIPTFSSSADFKVYEPQVKQEKGRKYFEQVIMPLSDQVKEVPAVTFSFFNATTGQYEVLTKGPFALKVSKPDSQEQARIIEAKYSGKPSGQEEVLGRDIIFIKETAGDMRRKGEFLYANKIFILCACIPALVLAVFYSMQKRRQKLKSDVRFARQLLAPRKAKQGLRKAKTLLGAKQPLAFYDCVFATIQEYLGDTFHLPSQGITASSIDELVSARDIPSHTVQKLRDIFKECDMARYASSGVTLEDMKSTFTKLQEVIDYFQRNKT